MPGNLDLTIRALINRKQTPTVASVFRTYMLVSGLDSGDANRSMLAFERALDKHPLREDDLSPVVAKVRNDYWYTKLGGTEEEGGVCRTCEHCGTLSLPNQKHKHKGTPKRSTTSSRKAGKPKL